MESLIALFEQDTELAFWQLRQRSEQADMSQSSFLVMFAEACKSGAIEVDTQSNCKLMCDIEPCTCAMECNEANNCRHLPKYIIPHEKNLD